MQLLVEIEGIFLNIDGVNDTSIKLNWNNWTIETRLD
jgi:hypothetical protein